MPSAGKESFRTLQTLQTDYTAGLITQYESRRSGMRVVVLDAKGPKVHGFFTLATEIHDDSGAPHTLEHLVFMGSRNYTYKGVLDRLANRAYAYTNAWTSVDHTGYNLDTAGWEGFAQILPVYLEHILLPTLTDAGCYTEVHHIDGTGHDAGVVYSEMQGVQNTASELMSLKAQRLIYPDTIGFRYETGGMMEQLRKLSSDRIRQFHREMYQPRNLCLILVGEVDHNNLLDILDSFEDGALPAIPQPQSDWERPWSRFGKAPPLKSTIVETVEFPEEDESLGEILIGFLGPDLNDRISCTALNILLVYIAGSSVSVLESILVEREQVAGEVSYYTEERPNTVIWFILKGVVTENLAAVEARFFDVLRDTASKSLDMEYMLECIRREKRQIKLEMEISPESIKTGLVKDFLFGKRDGTTLREMATLKSYDEVAAWSDQEWRDFLTKWVSDAAHVSILGTPSAELSEKLKANEQARVDARKAQLGEKGLQALEKKLADAKAENEVEVPRKLLEKYVVPDVESIHFIHTTTARGGTARKLGELDNFAQDIIKEDKAEVPLYLHFEHVETGFVHIKLVISLGLVSVEKRPLLPIYLENFFNCPVIRNGQRLEYETVVTQLEKDTIYYSIEGGGAIGNSEVLQIELQVELEQYQKAVQWLTELLWASSFDETRLKSTVAKLLAAIPEEKREGSDMAFAVAHMVAYAPEAAIRAQNTLVRALYMKRIRKLLQDEPQKVVSDLEELREALCRVENLRTLVTANLKYLKKPVTAWTSFGKGQKADHPLQPLDRLAERLSSAGKNPGGVAYLVPITSIDSSYSVHTTRGLDSYEHPQVPALMVALAYLNAVEGPLWRAVRGTGLAYGTGFYRSIESGLLDYWVYSSPDASKAFVASKAVVEGFISGTTPFDTMALEGAISKIVLNSAERQSSMASTAEESFINQVIREVPKDYNAQLLKKVRQVSQEDIKVVLRDLVLPVFQPDKANLVVTCAAVEQDRIKQGFENEGFTVQIRPLTSFQDDYGLKYGSTDDEKDEEDEGEGDFGGSSDDGGEATRE